MIRKRVIAYAMHEQEFAEISNRISNAEYTDSYVIGELSDEEIRELEANSIVVEPLAPPSTARTPGDVARELHRSHTASTGRTMRTTAAPPAMPPFDPTQPNPYLIRLAGPLLETWRERLQTESIQLLEYFPENSYSALLDLAQLQAARDLDFVDEVHAYGPEETDTTMVAAAAPAPGVPPVPMTYDIRLHSADGRAAVVSWLNQQGDVTIEGETGRKIRITLPSDSPTLDDLPFLPEVADIQQYVAPKLANDRARLLIGADRQQPPGGALLPHTGAGQVIGIADSGLDTNHPDFQGRILASIARGRPNDASDIHGHGTHVAGSVLGDGAASNGAIRGTAPDAGLVFQSVMDAGGGLGGLPLDLSELFEEAYQHGARIHNNSWSADTESLYTFSSIEVDEFVFDRRDMLIVIAAGNEGNAAHPRHSTNGFTDWLSMGSPATAKNALTVGASRTDRTSGGFSARTYRDVWPREFPDPPIADEPVSGDTDAIAGFSGRGPCDDRRIKPDLVAPGTDILSTRAATAPTQNFWGVDPAHPSYAFMGGTSMAAPLVSGCAAVVRQYFTDDRGFVPSAALLKATLVNGTRWLGSPSAIADHDKAPNYHQGFGALDLRRTLPNNTAPGMELQFVDCWQSPGDQLSVTGGRARFHFSTDGTGELRLCLAWTDPPGRGVQNALGIILEHQPSRTKWLGNETRRDALTPFDRDNNVHVIRLADPAPGDYVIQVFARNLLRPPQDYALVVTGNLAGSVLTRI
jgi:subtilisin family serine protease